jgi:hypothetical protein
MSANPDFDLVDQAFNLILPRDAEQRLTLIARRQDRMVKEPALNINAPARSTSAASIIFQKPLT